MVCARRCPLRGSLFASISPHPAPALLPLETANIAGGEVLAEHLEDLLAAPMLHQATGTFQLPEQGAHMRHASGLSEFVDRGDDGDVFAQVSNPPFLQTAAVRMALTT